MEVNDYTLDSTTEKNTLVNKSQSESNLNTQNDLPTNVSSTAWVDEEDQEIQISLNKRNNLRKLKKEKGEDLISGADFQERLRDQFVKMNAGADIYKWAFEEKAEEDSTETNTHDELDNLLKTNINPLEKHFDSNILQIKGLSDLNKGHTHSSIVSALSFHPTKDSLAFTAGLDKKLKLFSIDEFTHSSSLVQTVNTLDLPIYSAKFLNETEIAISGRRKHHYIYNLEKNKLDKCSGLFSHYKEISSLEKMFVSRNGSHYAFGTNEGYILVHDANNKTFRYDIKINGSVNSVCFDKNGINLYAVGDQSEVYVFDLRKYRHCVNKFSDSGNFNTTFMDCDDYYLATASNTGFVNLYSLEQIQNSSCSNIEPVKTVENLTTSCEFLKFNSTGNKLGLCSKWKKHAFKILNLNTMNVYSNFPTFTSRIKYPICFDFSVNDKYLAVGNDEGKALLYHIN